MLKGVISKILEHGKLPGVLTSKSDWESVMGGSSSCSSLAETGVPLWYKDLDGRPEIKNYKQVGGWKDPLMKQFSTKDSWCHLPNVTLNIAKKIHISG